VIELGTDKLFGLDDADCWLLGSNATAETEGGEGFDDRCLHTDLTLVATVQ
jgi:hypothetical protein